MGEPHIRMKAETVEGETWRRTGSLRWARPPHTTTKPDRLQEAWQSLRSGRIDWRDIPVVIVDDAALGAGQAEGEG